MTSRCTLQPEVHPFASTARVRPRGRAVLPVADYDLLLEYLEICERDRGPNWALLAYVLQNRIVNTEPSHRPVDRDIVVSRNEVIYSVSGASGLCCANPVTAALSLSLDKPIPCAA